MELRQLEHFVAVAEEGSFTRAAARVHVVQSGVSVSIRSLERELHARLFDRTTQRVELTDAGQALLPQARRALRAAEAGRDAVASVDGGLRGTVRLGIMQSVALLDLGGILTRFAAARPGIRVEPRLAPGGSAELVRLVADGQLDVAFAGLGTGYPDGVTVRPLAAAPLLLGVPLGHRLASVPVVDVRDLADEQFVEVPPGWGTRLSAERTLAAAGVSRRIAVEVPDLSTLVELVRAGLGLAFLTPSTVPDGRIALRPLDPSPHFEVALVARPEEHRSAAARAFIELVGDGAD